MDSVQKENLFHTQQPSTEVELFATFWAFPWLPVGPVPVVGLISGADLHYCSVLLSTTFHTHYIQLLKWCLLLHRNFNRGSLCFHGYEFNSGSFREWDLSRMRVSRFLKTSCPHRDLISLEPARIPPRGAR